MPVKDGWGDGNRLDRSTAMLNSMICNNFHEFRQDLIVDRARCPNLANTVSTKIKETRFPLLSVQGRFWHTLSQGVVSPKYS